MAQTPKKPAPPNQSAGSTRPLTRRGGARLRRERARQRMVVIASGTALGLALLAIIVGLLYDRVWVPSRPVAQVNSVSLARGDYWSERRNEIVRNIVQNLQLLRLFGDQAAAQFAGQTPALDAQVPLIRGSAVDDTTVNDWIDRQVIAQGAANQNIQASDGEIAQALVTDLSRTFPPPPPLITNTNALSDVANLTATAVTSDTAATNAPPATSAATSTPQPSPIPGGPTAQPSASATAEPTSTPEPTIAPEAALTEQDQVIERVFDAYNQEIKNVDPARNPNLTLEDFKAGMRDQYLRQVLTSKVQEQLVSEASFTPSTEPSNISVRHILIKNTVPLTATEAEREAGYQAARPQAEAILAQLRSGADFETMAKERSEDYETSANGGALPGFDPTGKTTSGTQIDPAIVQAVQPLQEGQISDLVKTPFGWHIVQLVTRTVDRTEDQLREARTKAFDTWVAEQRLAANIQHFPPQTATPTPAPTSETAAPLPTVDLAVLPTPTVISATNTLSGTGTLTDTGVVSGTPAPITSSPMLTSAPAITSEAMTPTP